MDLRSVQYPSLCCFFAALIVVLLLVAPHKPRIPDPPTKIDEFIPLPFCLPGPLAWEQSPHTQ